MWDVESDLKRIPGPTVGFQWCQADLEGFTARPAETRPETRKEAGLWIFQDHTHSSIVPVVEQIQWCPCVKVQSLFP